jgi:hypothetical protein
MEQSVAAVTMLPLREQLVSVGFKNPEPDTVTVSPTWPEEALRLIV